MLRCFCLSVLFVGSLHTYSQNPTAAQDSSVQLSLSNASIDSAIKGLINTYNVEVYYNKEWFKNLTISVDIENRSLLDVLNIILRGSGYEAQWLRENMYVLVSNNRRDFDYKVMLQGKIYGRENAKPIIGASISIPELGVSTISDTDGEYELEFNAGTYLILVRTLEGAQVSRVTQVYSDETQDFEVFDRVTELDEVVVTFQRADDNVTGALAGKVAYSVESIKKLPNLLGEVDITQVIRAMPGVQTVGEGSTGFNVRGGAIDQNLVQIDGIPIYNSSHLLGFTSVFNADLINDFEIYKGSMPSRYGGKLSSVVNVSLKNPTDDRFHFNGGIGPVSNKLAVNVPIKSQNMGFIGGVRHSNPTWILKSVRDINVRNSSASFTDFTLKIRKKINDRTIVALSSYSSNDTYDFGTNTAFDYRIRTFSFNINRQISDNLYGNFTAYHSAYAANKNDLNPNLGSTIENGISASGINIDFDISANQNSTWQFGSFIKASNYNAGIRKPLASSTITSEDFGDLRGIEGALYIENERKLNRKLSASVGLRASIYGIYEDDLIIFDPTRSKFEKVVLDTLNTGSLNVLFQNLEPRITLNWTLNTTSSIKTSFNRSVQYEHLFSSTTASLPTDIWRPSNQNILPGIANQFSVGLFKNLKSNIWSLSLESYFKNFENVNVPRTGAEILENKLIDAEIIGAKGTSYGLEFMARKNKGSITGWLSYFYSQTTFQTETDFNQDKINNGEKFAADFDAPHNLNVALNYQVSRLWSISSAFTYKSGRPVTLPSSSYALSGVRVFDVSNRNDFRIPDTHRLDISVTLEGSNKANKKWKNSFTFSLYNIYSRNNPFSLIARADNGVTPRAYKVSVFGNVIPSFTYNFSFNQ